MSKVLVLYYSAFGYVGIVANAIADGARSAGAVADLKRVPETAPAAGAQGALFNSMQDVPIAKIEDLANYDAIIVGSPTRFGRLSSPVAVFLEQASELLGRGILSGKVGGAFTSPSGVNGGQETASMSIITNLLHFGMIVVGPPYSATTLADTTGQRHPSALDLEGALQQGRLIAQAAEKLSGLGIPSAADLDWITADRGPTAADRNWIAPDDRQPRTAVRKAGAADRKPGAAGRKPDAADRKAGAADRKPSAADGKSGAADRKASASNGKPGAADRKASASNGKPGAADRKASAGDLKPGAADRKPSRVRTRKV